MPEASFPKAALLCIDDDQAVLECEKPFLETFGYTVVTASSGRVRNKPDQRLSTGRRP